MSCQEAFFAHAHCVIDIRPEKNPVGDPEWWATVSVLDPESGALRPLVFDDGTRLVIPGPSEPLALSSALTYLETRFGAFSEIAYGCIDSTRFSRSGAPLVIENTSA